MQAGLRLWFGVAALALVEVAAAQPAAPLVQTATPVAASVAQALYAFSATKAAADRITDANLLAQHQVIEKLQRQGAQAEARLAAAQDQYVAVLAQRDRAYAQVIAVFRKAVQDIVATPEGAAALRRFNAGDEPGALAVLDRLRAAHDLARAAAARIESAAEGRRIATLALEAKNRGRQSTKEVIDRFEKVIRLDPSVFWDWVELCRLYQEAGHLSAARDAARRATRVARDLRERSVALNEEAAIALAQGDLAAARARFQESLDLIKPLAIADPSSASLQSHLSVNLTKIGEVLKEQGDLATARARFQESLEIDKRLAAADPSSASLQRAVSVSLDSVGEVLKEQGELAAARARFQESLDLRKRLAAADPSSASLQRDVSVSLIKVPINQLAR